jgi:GPI-anchor transamidase subunit U
VCSWEAPDLAPNVGLSWYFFLEVFDTFRPFFRALFQLHVAVYAAPLAVRLWDTPLFMAHALLAVAALFKPYATVADAGLLVALTAVFSDILGRT